MNKTKKKNKPPLNPNTSIRLSLTLQPGLRALVRNPDLIKPRQIVYDRSGPDDWGTLGGSDISYSNCPGGWCSAPVESQTA